MENQLIQERHGKLLVIKINNPKKKNALNKQTYQELAQILNTAGTDDSISIVALTGSGGVGSFYTSGNDVTQGLQGLTGDMEEYMQSSKQNIYNFVKAFVDFPKLLIAVINGPCLGIGMTTAALCDVVYASDTVSLLYKSIKNKFYLRLLPTQAYFHTPFTKLGLCPEGCSSYTFPKIFGPSKATEILLLNGNLSAEEALQYKFVSEIFHGNQELESKIWPKIKEFSKLLPGSLAAGKKVIRDAERSELLKALELECDVLYERWQSPEFFQAIQDFATRKSKL